MVEDVEVFVEGKHEYTYVQEVEEETRNYIHTLRYSNSAEWSEEIRGSIALRIRDTGWGYNIEMESNGLMDYSDSYQLQLLLSLITPLRPYSLYKKVLAYNPEDYHTLKIKS